MTKPCTGCQEIKPLTEFGKDKRNLTGLQSRCNTCKKQHTQMMRTQRQQGDYLKKVAEKICNKCSTLKPIDEFYTDNGISDGHATICKICKEQSRAQWKTNNKEKWNAYMREYRKEHPQSVKDKEQKRNRGLKCRYGITSDEYDKLLLSQIGVCAICRKLPASNRKLVVDHSHITNEVRGLLCDGCNVAIAIFDNPILFEAAKKYLKLT